MAEPDPFKEAAQACNASLLRSIAENGLLPICKQSPENALPNFTLWSGAAEGFQSLTYINCLPGERPDASIHAALWSERAGIFPISLERAWPCISLKKHWTATAELQGRMQNQVVFVLKPPTVKKMQQHDRTFYHYQYNGRNAHEQDALIAIPQQTLHGEGTAQGTPVFELQTRKTLAINNKIVIAILVPEAMCEWVRAQCPAWEALITPVPNTAHTLARLADNFPKGEEQLAEGLLPLQCNIPDYQAVLHSLMETPQYCLHTARLSTPFDFLPRMRLQVDALPNIVFRHVIKRDEAQTWFITHRSLTAVLTAGHPTVDEACHQAWHTQILKAKDGDEPVDHTIVWKEARDELSQLLSDITHVKTPYGLMLGYPKDTKTLVIAKLKVALRQMKQTAAQAGVDPEPQVEEQASAVRIQAAMKGWFVRKKYLELCEARAALVEAFNPQPS